MLIAGLMQTTT